MRSKYAKKVLSETPESTRIFARWYGDIVLRVTQIMQEKGMTQKDLAEHLNKKPSEISKWLNGQHNFTLQSLAKLQAELGELVLYVPKSKSFQTTQGKTTTFTVHKTTVAYTSNRNKFISSGEKKIEMETPVVHVG